MKCLRFPLPRRPYVRWQYVSLPAELSTTFWTTVTIKGPHPCEGWHALVLLLLINFSAFWTQWVTQINSENTLIHFCWSKPNQRCVRKKDYRELLKCAGPTSLQTVIWIISSSRPEFPKAVGEALGDNIPKHVIMDPEYPLKMVI